MPTVEVAVAEPVDDVLVLTDRPTPAGAWWKDLWAHRAVLSILTRKDFQTRYKRASLGLLWAVALPILQAAVMTVIFSKVVGQAHGGQHFAAYLISGMVIWTYFSGTLAVASTAVVDGAGLTDKVWFPRAVLVVVPVLANLVGLAVSLVVFLAVVPVLGVGYHLRLLLIIPGCLLGIAFTLGAALVLSSLHVYFRDVRFIVQAALLLWLYVTPIVYPRELLGPNLAPLVDFNPMSGVVAIFRLATVGATGEWPKQVIVAVVVTVALLVAGFEAHRRHDRLFVDLL